MVKSRHAFPFDLPEAPELHYFPTDDDQPDDGDEYYDESDCQDDDEGDVTPDGRVFGARENW